MGGKLSTSLGLMSQSGVLRIAGLNNTIKCKWGCDYVKEFPVEAENVQKWLPYT
jgi:hypothetical protein